MVKNKYEYLNHDLLTDLGFERIENDHNGCIDMFFEVGYRHPDLDPLNLILVDFKNGCWHFAQRKWAMNGIGRMQWLDDLIIGFEFVTGKKLLK
jgi:hypothetical protein